MNTHTSNLTKILALDLGDQWVGSALSDNMRLLARPYKTVAASQLEEFLSSTLQAEPIGIVVVGYPITLKGKESEQTRKVETLYQALVQKFPDREFVKWDERLSSQRAATLTTRKTKEEKLHSHSVAAAFILDSYLSYLAYQKTLSEDCC